MLDPFATLGVERRFDLDLAVLEKTHRELSRALHPDKYTQTGASERRAALEKAASVNEAWRMVRDPVRRAEALFRVHGIAVGEDNEPKATPAKEIEKRLAAGFGSAADASAIAKLVPLLGELRFYKRFLDEVSAIEEENE
jgi:molecular chaperone HscB